MNECDVKKLHSQVVLHNHTYTLIKMGKMNDSYPGLLKYTIPLQTIQTTNTITCIN